MDLIGSDESHSSDRLSSDERRKSSFLFPSHRTVRFRLIFALQLFEPCRYSRALAVLCLHDVQAWTEPADRSWRLPRRSQMTTTMNQLKHRSMRNTAAWKRWWFSPSRVYSSCRCFGGLQEKHAFINASLVRETPMSAAVVCTESNVLLFIIILLFSK